MYCVRMRSVQMRSMKYEPGFNLSIPKDTLDICIDPVPYAQGLTKFVIKLYGNFEKYYVSIFKEIFILR